MIQKKLTDLDSGLELKIVEKQNKKDSINYEQIMKELINKIAYGNVLLFLGAGFSKNTKNLADKEPPLVDELIQEIKNLIDEDIEEELNLKEITDYFIEDICKSYPEKKDKLIDRLQQLYTIKETSSMHETIIKLPWKKIYTTNYDDTVESTSKKIGKKAIPLTIADSASEYYNKQNVCVHLNGYIDRLNSETLNTSFKLSHSSYLSPPSFVDSPNWGYNFKKDLETCSAILFIGYSLYDIEIEKLLYENELFKKKTYFIKSNKPLSIKDKKIEKYGTLISCGTEGFSREINRNSINIEMISKEFYLEAFTKLNLDIGHNISNITTNKILDFLNYGSITDENILNGLTSEQKPSYLIKRTMIDSLKNEIKDYKMPICILSNMANGKSIFLKELAYLCLIDSLGEVLFLTSQDISLQIQDIDKMVKDSKTYILFVDNYGFYLELVNHYLHLKPKNIKLILTERFTNHKKIQIEKNIFKEVKEFVIDKLDNDEIKQLSKILQTTALDIKKAGKSENEKVRYLKDELNSEISSVLMDVIKAPQSIDRTKELIENIFNDKKLKSTLFALCLLEVMNIPATHALVSEISLVDNLFSITSRDKKLEEIFTYDFHNSIFKPKSSVYAKFMLEYIFGEDPNYIVEQCIFILKKLESIGKTEIDKFQDEVRINLLKFNFIESILPKQKVREMLLKYYETVKKEFPRHENNPHYWLQFAMAHIALKELEKAEQYLNYAYEQATRRDDYNTNYIDTQKARLLIKKASQGHITQDESMKFFVESDRLLSTVPNNMYKYKIVSEYLTFFETKSSSLSKKNKDILKKSANNRLQEIEKIDKDMNIENMKQDRILEKAKNSLTKIIDILKA